MALETEIKKLTLAVTALAKIMEDYIDASRISVPEGETEAQAETARFICPG